MHSLTFTLYLVVRTKLLRNWLEGQLVRRLSELLNSTRRPDGLWGRGTPQVLDTAFAVLCCQGLGLAIPEAAKVLSFLMDCQLPDGGWCWAPLFSDGSGCWFGHRAVTTIAAVRAIEYLGGSPACAHITTQERAIR